jgi:hypothetical protein
MDIEEIKKMKAELERKIFAAILDYEHQTGTTVEEIELYYFSTFLKYKNLSNVKCNIIIE